MASSDEAARAGAPDDANRLLAENLAFAAAFDLRQKRPDMLLARGERGAIEAEALGIDPAPVELRRQERLFWRSDRASSPPARDRRIELGEAREFLTTSVADGFRQFAFEIAEERERLLRPPFLAHEQHRRLRQEEIDARERPDSRRGGKRGQPLAERAVADLVVVLDEGDESAGRKLGARAAARRSAVGRDVALEGESLRQAPWPRSFVSP